MAKLLNSSFPLVLIFLSFFILSLQYNGGVDAYHRWIVTLPCKINGNPRELVFLIDTGSPRNISLADGEAIVEIDTFTVNADKSGGNMKV